MLLDRDDTHIYLPANSKPHWQTAFMRTEQVGPRDNFSASHICGPNFFCLVFAVPSSRELCRLIPFNQASWSMYSNQLDIKKT